ncbi:hypothetical protein ACNULB_01500 [Clostridium perfringens]|uniref:hypothetical protein n=1 Tax=Clostridium perfringens TaxID=1502 RepID=UPI003AFFEF06
MNRERRFRIWKIIITIISFSGIIFFKFNIDFSNLSNSYWDINLLKDVLYDLCIGIFSALVLVWIIDDINNNIQKEREKEKELAEIKRIDRVLQLYIEHYELLYYCVVTPIEKRDFSKVSMPADFKLSDMKDLYKISLLANESIIGSAIESFLDIELQLRNKVESILEKINFEYYSEISDILSEFLEASLKCNSRDNVLQAKNINVGDKPYINYIEELLKNSADQIYTNIINGAQYSGGAYHPYINIYEMMKAEREIILKYKNMIRNL